MSGTSSEAPSQCSCDSRNDEDCSHPYPPAKTLKQRAAHFVQLIHGSYMSSTQKKRSWWYKIKSKLSLLELKGFLAGASLSVEDGKGDGGNAWGVAEIAGRCSC